MGLAVFATRAQSSQLASQHQLASQYHQYHQEHQEHQEHHQELLVPPSPLQLGLLLQGVVS